jgi:hypothetical protein
MNQAGEVYCNAKTRTYPCRVTRVINTYAVWATCAIPSIPEGACFSIEEDSQQHACGITGDGLLRGFYVHGEEFFLNQ